jgi:hypothetical protein
VARAYCGTRISEHIIEDNAGFLIATAPICRSGWQQYRRSELDPESRSDETIDCWRDPSEVTSAATLASIEGKPVTLSHPARLVDPNSWAWNAKGHAQNARVGPPDADGNIQIWADLHIQDQSLIDRIQNGTRDLSCGYEYTVDDGPEPGTYAMTQIRMNHVAIVPRGRSGTSRILDSDGELHLPPTGGVEFETEDEDLFPEDNMVKTKTKDKNEDNGQVQRLCELLEKFLGKMSEASTADDTQPDLIPVVELAESERGTNPVVDALRMVKPFIAASGNRKAIDAFNLAMKSAKRGDIGPAERLIAACDRLESESSFQAAVDRRRRELLGEKTEETRDVRHHAQDRRSSTETYQETVDRVRRRMLTAK